MEQKFNSKKAKQLLDDYQQQILKYTTNNQNKLKELEDLKTTLTLNQNMLYDITINKLEKTNNNIKFLVDDTKLLWNKNEVLIDKKNKYELEINKLQSLIEDTPNKIREEIDQINISNNKLKNTLLQKDNTIKKLTNELNKARNNALFKTARIEILVSEPSKMNVELNNELISAKKILVDAQSIHNTEKKESTKLDEEITQLQDDVYILKDKAIKLQNQLLTLIDNQNINEDIDLGNNLEIYDFIFKNDDDDNEFEEDEGQCSDDGSDESNGKSKKKKEKELKKLNDEYEKLKIKNNEHLKRIDEYKEKYKTIKSKMDNLRNKQYFKSGLKYKKSDEIKVKPEIKNDSEELK